MVLGARILGVLVVLFGLIGLAVTSAGQGMQMSVPSLEGSPWTGELRAAADYAVYALAIGSGIALASQRLAVPIGAVSVLAAAARLGFDLVAADFTTARGQTICTGDVVAVSMLAVALIAALASSAVRRRQ